MSSTATIPQSPAIAGRLSLRQAGAASGDPTPLRLNITGAPSSGATSTVTAILTGALETADPITISTGLALATAWRQAGAGCLTRILGEWIAVVWDQGSQTLSCARSAHGHAPLFWRADSETLHFATSMADLVPSGATRRLDEGFLAELLANRVTTHTETPFIGLRRLAPGHLLTAAPGRRPRVTRWHKPTPTAPPSDHGELIRWLRWTIETVVADHIPASGVGVLVSGGIDSNAVFAVARNIAQDHRVEGYSMVFPGQDHDESRWLDLVDRGPSGPTHRLTPPAYDWSGWRAWSATSLLPPLRPNAALNDAVIATVAAAGLRQVLTGEGGDDWFGGGPLHWPALLRTGHAAQLIREVLTAYPRPRRAAGALWHAGIRPLLPNRRRPALPPWIRQGFASRVALADRLRQADLDLHRAARDPVTARVSRVGTTHGRWQLEGVRSRFDTYGVRWLHPLHDQRVTDLVLGLPPGVLWRHDQPKSLLRAAVTDLVPAGIVRRYSKTGFNTPIVEAIRAGGGVATLVDHPLVTGGYLDLAALRDLEHTVLARYDAGLRPRGAHEAVTSLWAVLSTTTWFSSVWPE